MVDAAILTLIVVVLATSGLFVRIWIEEARQPRVICLLYHRFAPRADHDRLTGAERVFQVPLDRFEQQLERLTARGFRCVTADQVVGFLSRGELLPQRAVQITIDDGSLSVLEHAQRLLERHGCRATLFLTTDPGAPIFGESGQRRMTEEELRALDPGVIEIEAHGRSHRPLVELDDAALRQELEGCRADIERLLGGPATHLAVPGGWYDRRVLRAASAAGFHGVWVSDAGANRGGGDPLRIRRLNVDGFAGPDDFDRLFRPLAVAQLRLFSTLKRLPGRLLGPRRWLPLRRRLRAVIRAEMLSFRTLRRVGIVVTGAFALAVIWWLWFR